MFEHYMKRLSQRSWGFLIIEELDIEVGAARVRLEHSAFVYQYGQVNRKVDYMFTGWFTCWFAGAKIKSTLPFMASVGMAAPTPRQSSFGVARRGILQTITSINAAEDSQQAAWQIAPARKRPKRLKVVKAKTAAERFKAATAKVQSSGGEKIYEVDKAADAILKMLKEKKSYRVSAVW